MSRIDSVQQLAVLVLAGGGAAGVYTLVKAVILLRDSTDTREASAIKNLEKWRVDADRRAEYFQKAWEFQRKLTDHWWRRAGQLEYTVRANGIEVPPVPDEPKMPEDLVRMHEEEGTR